MGTPAPARAGDTVHPRRSHHEDVRCRFMPRHRPKPNSAEERAHGSIEVEPEPLDGAPTDFARVRPPQYPLLPQCYVARLRSPHGSNLQNGPIVGVGALIAAFGDPRDLPPPWGHAGPAFGVGRVPPQVLQQVFALQPSSTTLADALFCLFFAGSAAPQPAQQQQRQQQRWEQQQSRRSSSRAGSRGGSNSRAGRKAAETAVAAVAGGAAFFRLMEAAEAAVAA